MSNASRMGKFLPNCEIGAIHIQSDFADKAPREFKSLTKGNSTLKANLFESIRNIRMDYLL